MWLLKENKSGHASGRNRLGLINLTMPLLALVAFADILSVPDPEPLRHVDLVRPKATVLPVETHGFNHGLQPHFIEVIRRPFE